MYVPASIVLGWLLLSSNSFSPVALDIWQLSSLPYGTGHHHFHVALVIISIQHWLLLPYGIGHHYNTALVIITIWNWSLLPYSINHVIWPWCSVLQTNNIYVIDVPQWHIVNLSSNIFLSFCMSLPLQLSYYDIIFQFISTHVSEKCGLSTFDMSNWYCASIRHAELNSIIVACIKGHRILRLFLFCNQHLQHVYFVFSQDSVQKVFGCNLSCSIASVG